MELVAGRIAQRYRTDRNDHADRSDPVETSL